MPTRERLLALIDILLRQTDEEHPISGVKLAKELNKLGIAAEKRAIYADIAALAERRAITLADAEKIAETAFKEFSE